MSAAELLKATVYLKSGVKLDCLIHPDREFSADSLTNRTLQAFQDEKYNYLVQGDWVDYIAVERPVPDTIDR